MTRPPPIHLPPSTNLRSAVSRAYWTPEDAPHVAEILALPLALRLWLWTVPNSHHYWFPHGGKSWRIYDIQQTHPTTETLRDRDRLDTHFHLWVPQDPHAMLNTAADLLEREAPPHSSILSALIRVSEPQGAPGACRHTYHARVWGAPGVGGEGIDPDPYKAVLNFLRIAVAPIVSREDDIHGALARRLSGPSHPSRPSEEPTP